MNLRTPTKSERSPPHSRRSTPRRCRAGQRAALELTEAAREDARGRGFVSGLFMGRFDFDALHPFPAADAPRTATRATRFSHGSATFLRDTLDPDEIDRTGEIPDARLRRAGEARRVRHQDSGANTAGSVCRRRTTAAPRCCSAAIAAISPRCSPRINPSACRSRCILFGTEEQKRTISAARRRAARVSAFALTEPKVGSDPAKMETHAEPTADGEHFILNGEKLWCTNGVKAGVIVVMAQTPPKRRAASQITAFIVEMDTPGVEIVHRCHFMGLRALYNGVDPLHRRRRCRARTSCSREGKGLRVALTTLNTGRLTLPAACTGLVKRCLEISREWAAERVQWGAPIGKHAAIADKLARMAARDVRDGSDDALRREPRRSRQARRRPARSRDVQAVGHRAHAGSIVNDTMQIRGGRGYETADIARGARRRSRCRSSA